MSVLSALSVSRSPAAAFAILGMYWGSFAAFIPQVKQGLGASDDTFGLLLLGTALGLVSAMWMAPRLDRRLGARAMPTAALLLACAFLLPGLAPSTVLFFAAMVVVGAASGLTDVVMNARVSELEASHARPLMNANHGMFSAAYAVGAVLAGLSREAGVPPVLHFACLAVLPILALRLLTVPTVAAPAADPAAGGMPWGTVLIAGSVVLMAFLSEAAVESWSALHVERTLGGSAAEGALGPAMLGLTMAVGRFSGQAVSTRFRETAVITWAALVAATGAIIAATAPTPAIAYAGFGILGLGVSVIGPIGIALAGRLVPPSFRTEAISKAAVIGFCGFFLAPTGMGLISEHFGLRVAFGAIALVLLCVPPAAAILVRRGA
jgi:MFS family permease